MNSKNPSPSDLSPAQMRARYQSIFENSAVGIAVVSLEGIIEHVNICFAGISPVSGSAEKSWQRRLRKKKGLDDLRLLEASRSMGMKIIDSLTGHDLGGSIHWEDENGLVVNIDFPCDT